MAATTLFLLAAGLLLSGGDWCDAFQPTRLAAWRATDAIDVTSCARTQLKSEAPITRHQHALHASRRECVSLLTSAVASVVMASPRDAAAASDTSSSDVCTVVIDGPELLPSLGIQFIDSTIESREFPLVDKVEPNGLAAAAGVRPGMVLLGRESATKSSKANVEFRLRNGPYPFVMQFAAPDVMLEQKRQLKETLDTLRAATSPTDAYGGAYGRLSVQTVRKPTNCERRAQRGDVLTFKYEARIASATGPIYDSTAWRGGQSTTLELGKGSALSGVEAGLTKMCAGEIRTIDMPAALGYGKFGSSVFDIPGDVRLRWRVELLDLAKGSGKANWKYK
ncbi:hypothetical protein ACHAXT_004211 [Thalassiosira profunda]